MIHTLLIVVCVLQNINAKNVQIQIDSDDILKLLKTLVDHSSVKQTTANNKRAIVQMSYKNPYHPEDEIEEPSFSLNTSNSKLKDDIAADKEKKIDENIDKDNDKFVSDTGNRISEEDILDMTNTIDQSKLRTNQNQNNSSHMNNLRKDINSDTSDFNMWQKRFVLKS